MAIYKNSYPFGNIVRSGLVLNLDATNLASYPGSGSLWYDTSGNGNSGSLTNGPTYLQERGRGSIVFDGVNDYVGFGSPTILKPTTSLTLSTWVNATAYDSQFNAVLGMSNYGFAQGYLLDTNPNGIVFQVGDSTWAAVSGSRASTGSWVNYTGTWDGSIVKLYINAQQSTNTASKSSVTYTNTTFDLGRYGNNSFKSYTGNISLVQVYNRALTAAEVQQNFNALRNRFGI